MASQESQILVALDNAEWIEAVSGDGSVERLLQLLPVDANVLLTCRDETVIRPLATTTLALLPLSRFEAQTLVDKVLADFKKSITTFEFDTMTSNLGAVIPGLLVPSLRMLVSDLYDRDEIELKIRNIPATLLVLCDRFLDSLEKEYGVDAIRLFLRRLSFSTTHGGALSSSGLAGEGEILRRFYSIFPENCTPPESGFLLRPGALSRAIADRYGAAVH